MKKILNDMIISYFRRLHIVQLFFILFLILITVLIPAHYTPVNAQGLQNITITGSVTDGTTGEPLLGVNIIVQGTTTGVVTDLSGNFTIIVPNEKAVLVFSFIGYQTISVAVGSQRQINIALKPEVAAIEELVVVGYGVQKKESVVGAISQASGEIVKQGVQGADLGVALQGALPGLAIIRTNGLPGGRDMGIIYWGVGSSDDDYAYMYIRGQKTWNNSAPLVLVDGVERPLNNINPYEIEKISLLKDASATSVFGVKGANGVILITTLRGKEGKSRITINVTGTGKTMSKFMHREGSYMGNLMKNYAILNEVPVNEPSWNSIVPGKYLIYYRDQTYPEYLPDIDWVDTFTRKWGYDENINMSFTGGTKVVKYYGSLSWLHEGDIFALSDVGQGYSPNFKNDRFTFRNNLDFDITPTTRFSANLFGYYIAQQRTSGNSRWTGWAGFYSRPPDLYPPRYKDGTWADYRVYSRFQNCLYLFDMFGFEIYKETNLNTDFMLNQKLDFVTKGLSVSGKSTFDNTFTSLGPLIIGNGTITKWIPPDVVDSLYPGIPKAIEDSIVASKTIWQLPTGESYHGFDYVFPPNYYQQEDARNSGSKLYYEMSINYQRDFSKHTVSGLALFSRQQQVTGSTFPSYSEDWVSRITYGYDRRYNLELNAAYNGSEKFSSKYRFGFFPSYALGWTISNEPFFEIIKPVVSNLKVRWSDGKIGSDAGIARWQYVSSWIIRPNTTSTSSQNVWRFGAPFIQNALPLRYEGIPPNPDLHWEMAQKRDLGIETGFFDNVLRMNVDYFWEKRTNIFMSGSDITIPDYFGKTAVSQNLGRVDAHGWEYEFQFSKTWQNGLNIWATYSWTFAKEKVIDRNDPLFKPVYQKNAGYQVGQPRYTLNQDTKPLLTWNDIYNVPWGSSSPTNALPGDFARIDYNSDGIIDTNDDIPWGYPARPQYTYAPSLGAKYKNISFNIKFYGVYNIEGAINSYNRNFIDGFTVVYPYVKEKSWSPEFNKTTTATNPGVRFNSTSTSGYFDRSRAYLRLQHVELSYLLTSQWMKKMGVTSLKFIVSGDNLWLRSKMYEDLDAPQITSETNLRRQYPTVKRVNVGLSFNFQ